MADTEDGGYAGLAEEEFKVLNGARTRIEAKLF